MESVGESNKSNILKLKNGKYIDVSKIVAVSHPDIQKLPGSYIPSTFLTLFVNFQLCEKAVDVLRIPLTPSDSFEHWMSYGEEARDQIIGAWKGVA